MSLDNDLIELFRAQAWIDDPFLGPVLPDRLEASSFAWPSHPRWESVELLKELRAGSRTVWELWYNARSSANPRLPVGIVWDETVADRPLARIYFNKQLVDPEWTDTRPPMIPPDPAIELHPTMVSYVEALHHGDVDGLLAVFDPEFQVRAPHGQYIEPEDGLTAGQTFAHRMSNGVPIMYVTSTDDGQRAALEFISWRNPPHAGLGVYERSATGKIVEFRNYEGPVRFGPVPPPSH
jgi:hypothetical protein